MPRVTIIIVTFACGIVALRVDGEAQTFKGYLCTVDCSGHQAGYDWAQENGVIDESDCRGSSNSFNEGCQGWIEEQDVDRTDNDEGGDGDGDGEQDDAE